ncbi:Gp43 [Burkholderiales bacterium GJ-E10]|nr:Gp43 [Burkholderiales bacterium GJ-E10]
MILQATKNGRAGTVELSDAEAFALAQLCKRISWSAARDLSVDEEETSLMLNAADRVRGVLAEAGCAVR